MDPIRKITTWYFTKNALPYWCILVIDCAIIVVAGMVSTYICNGGNDLSRHFWPNINSWLITLPCYLLGMRIFHTYSGVLRYTTTIDFIKVIAALFVGSTITAILGYVIPEDMQLVHFSLKVLGVATILSTIGLWALRILMKYVYEITISSSRTHRAFIYGTHEGGVAIARAIKDSEHSRFQLAGFVSTDGSMESKYLMGVKVRRNGPNLVEHMREVHANTLIVSPIQVDNFRSNDEQIKSLLKAGIKIMVMPEAERWDPTKQVEQQQLREVEIEDLLPREKIQVDMNSIGAMLEGKRILITGAAGSIGSEMVRQVARFSPKKLVLIDQAETPMHDVRLFMNNNYPNIECYTIVGSISNAAQMENLFSTHRPEYVFHAAAYKHVPMMEDNPSMAIQNNTYGTRVIADLAVLYGTKKFVMISTDKAVNPTNVMGCSKRICEIYCQSLNKEIQDNLLNPDDTNKSVTQLNGSPAITQFITTRFGNVLGSNGSVIPIFKEQIKKGGPVTVTHPDIIRFFMLIPEACQLVLEAGTMGKGGEIFVFDMGKPVRIADLAQRMIDLTGAKGVEIKFTGLRDGEKLYEEVLNDEEQTKPTHHPKIKVAAVREYDYNQALADEEELYQLSFSFDDMAIVKKMKEIVPEYRSQHSKYEVLDN